MTYLTYLAATQHLWHSCMSMWMCVHGIKTRKHEANPNLNMWKSKWITSMWNRILKPQIYEKGTKIEVLHVKSKTKSEKLGFLGRIMCTHEQAYVRIIKPTYGLQNDKSNILACFQYKSNQPKLRTNISKINKLKSTSKHALDLTTN